jgi:hypothetical protein
MSAKCGSQERTLEMADAMSAFAIHFARLNHRLDSNWSIDRVQFLAPVSTSIAALVFGLPKTQLKTAQGIAASY